MSTKTRVRRQGVWLAAGTAVVLGVATTAVAAGTGEFHTTANAPYSAGCQAPAPVGTQVRVAVYDMGRMMNNRSMMGGGFMMRGGFMMGGGSARSVPGRMGVAVAPRSVPAGKITLDVVNAGRREHEILILPLTAGQQIGQRTVGFGGRIDESASLGEVSYSCAAGAGDGLKPGATGWTTITLVPGRYELVCDIPGHYAAGAFAELDVG